MDFINKGYAQLADLFRSMTPGARITAGLLLTMVVVSLAYLVNHSSSGGGSYLMGGEMFSAAQLPSMQAAFAKANLHDAVVDGNRIRVPLGQESVYMGALASSDALPATFGTYLEKAVRTNPWTSKEQRREATKIAKQNELQLIISHMRGIENAAVLYDVEEAKSFGRESVTTASVSVQPKAGATLDDNMVRMVRNTVAGAIAGLKPERVTVTDLTGGRTFPGSSDANGSMSNAADDIYGARKLMYEKQWAEKISSALSYIPGVLVASNVELDTEISHEESSTDFDPKTVTFNERRTDSTKTVRSGGGTGGRPGLASNQAHGSNQPAAVGSSAQTENGEEATTKDTVSAVSSKSRQVKTAALTPKRVTVAVSIPSNYYEKVWLERNPPVAGQPAKKPDATAIDDIKSTVNKDVKEAVNALLPAVVATQDPFPRVNVTSFQTLPSAPLVPPALPAKILDWAGQYWNTLGMMAIALVSLVMLRSMVRALPAAASATSTAGESLNLTSNPEETTTDSGEAAATAAGGAQNVRSRLKRRPPGGPSLREELSELVKEDPESAVTVLRAWIGTAS